MSAGQSALRRRSTLHALHVHAPQLCRWYHAATRSYPPFARSRRRRRRRTSPTGVQKLLPGQQEGEYTVVISGDEPPSLTDRLRRKIITIHFPSVRISARVDAACCMATSASQSSAGSTVSRFAVGPAERPTGAARTRGLAITAPPAEKRASTCPGRAEAMACE